LLLQLSARELLGPVRSLNRPICFCLHSSCLVTCARNVNMERTLYHILYLCICFQSFTLANSCQWKRLDLRPLDSVV